MAEIIVIMYSEYSSSKKSNDRLGVFRNDLGPLYTIEKSESNLQNYQGCCFSVVSGWQAAVIAIVCMPGHREAIGFCQN